jgi:hypothetical protein
MNYDPATRSRRDDSPLSRLGVWFALILLASVPLAFFVWQQRVSQARLMAALRAEQAARAQAAAFAAQNSLARGDTRGGLGPDRVAADQAVQELRLEMEALRRQIGS